MDSALIAFHLRPYQIQFTSKYKIFTKANNLMLGNNPCLKRDNNNCYVLATLFSLKMEPWKRESSQWILHQLV